MEFRVFGRLICQLNQSRYCFSKLGIYQQNPLLYLPVASQDVYHVSTVCTFVAFQFLFNYVLCNCNGIYRRPGTLIASSSISHSICNFLLYSYSLLSLQPHLPGPCIEFPFPFYDWPDRECNSTWSD